MLFFLQFVIHKFLGLTHLFNHSHLCKLSFHKINIPVDILKDQNCCACLACKMFLANRCGDDAHE